jgi:hypothetical protein
LGGLEQIMGISIISYGKNSLDLRPTWVMTSSRMNWVRKSRVHCIYNSIISGHLSKQNSYIQNIMPLPYVSVMVSFPFGSRTVATGALYVAEPYRWTAASRFLGRPDGTWGKSSYYNADTFQRDGKYSSHFYVVLSNYFCLFHCCVQYLYEACQTQMPVPWFHNNSARIRVCLHKHNSKNHIIYI